MRFSIFSRYMAESQLYMLDHGMVENFAWVSIYTPGDSEAKVVSSPQCQGVLPIAFHDCDKEYAEMGVYPMLKEDAEKIVDFVLSVKDKVEQIFVHCDAGICRSSATALALSLWLNGHDSGIGDDKRYMPNIHVKSTILSVLRERGLI